tara:strand:+ start:7499 stop:8329 length:831 start_codon:yes stop_codon:yes gene_type:complete
MDPITRPLIICAGAQKAGTSWLYKCLEEHKEICAADGKETNFFLSENKKSSEEYLNLFKQCDNRPYLFEASPLYLYELDTAHKILTKTSNAKVIIILRDPVERTISHFNHLKNTGVISKELSLVEAVKGRPELLEHSRYKKYCEPYINQFPNTNILFLNFDDIKERPQEIINEVCRFCGVETFTPRFLNKKYNSSNARSNKLYGTMTKLYIKLKNNFFGIQLLTLFRFLGIKSDILEKFLAKTSTEKPEQSSIDVEFLRETLQAESEFSNTLKYGN